MSWVLPWNRSPHPNPLCNLARNLFWIFWEYLTRGASSISRRNVRTKTTESSKLFQECYAARVANKPKMASLLSWWTMSHECEWQLIFNLLRLNWHICLIIMNYHFNLIFLLNFKMCHICCNFFENLSLNNDQVNFFLN